MFKSTNSGGNWSAVNTGLTAGSIHALAIDPADAGHALCGNIRGRRFQEHEWRWELGPINTGLTPTMYTPWRSTRSRRPPSMRAPGSGGVFKSTNSGGNWSAANTGLTNTVIRALAIDPVTPATLYAGHNGGGVFKSTDGGGSWSTGQHRPELSGSTPWRSIRLHRLPSMRDRRRRRIQEHGQRRELEPGQHRPVTPVYSLAIDPVTPATL